MEQQKLWVLHQDNPLGYLTFALGMVDITTISSNCRSLVVVRTFLDKAKGTDKVKKNHHKMDNKIK